MMSCKTPTGSSATKDGSLDEVAPGRHVTATNCEIFIDKLTVTVSSHGSLNVFPYVKILKDRLDGNIAEVGFRNQLTSSSHGSGDIPYTQDWRNTEMTSRSPTNDYWTVPYGLMVVSDFGSGSYQGLFYVKTDKNTFYWAKTADGGNFSFGMNAADAIYHMYPHGSGNYNSGPEAGIPTQERDDMRQYNPQRCY